MRRTILTQGGTTLRNGPFQAAKRHESQAKTAHFAGQNGTFSKALYYRLLAKRRGMAER